MTTQTKPPLGVTPRWVWIDQRIEELEQAIKRYKAAKMDWPPEWAEELEELRLDHEPLPEKKAKGVKRLGAIDLEGKRRRLDFFFRKHARTLGVVARLGYNNGFVLDMTTEQAKSLAEWIQRYIRQNG